MNTLLIIGYSLTVTLNRGVGVLIQHGVCKPERDGSGLCLSMKDNKGKNHLLNIPTRSSCDVAPRFLFRDTMLKGFDYLKSINKAGKIYDF